MYESNEEKDTTIQEKWVGQQGAKGGSLKEKSTSEGTEFHKRYAAIHAYLIQGALLKSSSLPRENLIFHESMKIEPKYFWLYSW